MNLGLVGDETIHIVADMEWINAKFLEIIDRAKPKWLVTYDLPGAAELRGLLKPEINLVNPDDFFSPRASNLTVKRLVLTNTSYQPRWCEIALLDTDILAWVEHLVIVSNGQTHSVLDSFRQGKILEVNYLEKSERWQEYV